MSQKMGLFVRWSEDIPESEFSNLDLVQREGQWLVCENAEVTRIVNLDEVKFVTITKLKAQPMQAGS